MERLVVSGLSRSSVSQLVGLTYRMNGPATSSADLGWRGRFASAQLLRPVALRSDGNDLGARKGECRGRFVSSLGSSAHA